MDILKWRKLVSDPCDEVLISSEGSRMEWLCRSRDVPGWINQHPMVEACLAWWKDDTTLCVGYSTPNGAFLPIFSYKRAAMLNAMLKNMPQRAAKLCALWRRKHCAKMLYNSTNSLFYLLPSELCHAIASYVW
jgi:hypothetical protein